MERDYMQSEQIGELAAALAMAQAEISCPEKNRTVKVRAKSGARYDFRYTTLDQVIETVRPALTANALWFTQLLGTDGWLEEGKHAYRLRTILMHSSGQWLGTDTPVPVEESGIQSLGSAVTYIRRYALCGILGITAEEDDDANSSAGNEAEFEARPGNDNRKPDIVEWTGSAEPQKILPHQDNVIKWSQMFLSALNKADDSKGWLDANMAILEDIRRTAPVVFERLSAQIEKRIAELEASQQKTETGAGPHQPNSQKEQAADSLVKFEADLTAASSRKELSAVYASHEATIRAGGQEYQDAAVKLFLQHEKRLKKAA